MKDKYGASFVVDHKNVAVGIHRDAFRLNQFSHSDSVQILSVRPVDGNPLVFGVGDEQILMQRHGDVDGLLELTRLTTADAEFQLIIATAVGKYLDRLVVSVRDHDSPVR